MQSQTVSKRKTLTILVQIEYGKYSEKSLRHKNFPRDLQVSLAERVARNPQQDVAQTRQDGADTSELEMGKDIPSLFGREEDDSRYRESSFENPHTA